MPLVQPDTDDPKALRFDALMYGIELAYLAGKRYSRARSDLIILRISQSSLKLQENI